MISLSGFVLCYTSVPLIRPILDIILPLNETRPKEFPNLVDYVIINQEKYYYPLLLNAYLSYIICILLVIGADTTYILLVEHICGMYAILW
ncbi:hypothetical protein P5V15_001838 [Pogonomyrmex californicus]